VGLLATFALGSHAAAVAGSGWAILGDFIHLTAAALWLGGLIALALLLWQWYQQPAVDLLRLRQIVRRFSRLATLAVFVLVVTGLFSTLVQLPTLADLWRTTYGQLLLLKIALVLTALGLAWFNHRFVRTDGAAPTDPRFARRVWREAAVGVGIMIVVALLVQTPPPPAPLATAPPALWETILQADDLTIHLQIAPNQVGDNRYIAHLYHADNSSIGTVQLVRLTFSHQTAALGQASLDLTAQGGDFFAGAGAYQNRAGPWDLALYVRRRGLDDLLATTTVAVPPPVASAPRDPWQNPIATLPAELVLGALVGAFLVLPLIWRYSRRFTPTVE
jgi:copper transport protein